MSVSPPEVIVLRCCTTQLFDNGLVIENKYYNFSFNIWIASKYIFLFFLTQYLDRENMIDSVLKVPEGNFESIN